MFGWVPVVVEEEHIQPSELAGADAAVPVHQPPGPGDCCCSCSFFGCRPYVRAGGWVPVALVLLLCPLDAGDATPLVPAPVGLLDGLDAEVQAWRSRGQEIEARSEALRADIDAWRSTGDDLARRLDRCRAAPGPAPPPRLSARQPHAAKPGAQELLRVRRGSVGRSDTRLLLAARTDDGATSPRAKEIAFCVVGPLYVLWIAFYSYVANKRSYSHHNRELERREHVERPRVQLEAWEYHAILFFAVWHCLYPLPICIPALRPWSIKHAAVSAARAAVQIHVVVPRGCAPMRRHAHLCPAPVPSRRGLPACTSSIAWLRPLSAAIC